MLTELSLAASNGVDEPLVETSVLKLSGDDGRVGRQGVERALVSRCAVAAAVAVAVFRSTPSRFPIARVSSSGCGELMGRPKNCLAEAEEGLGRLLDLGENGARTAWTRERRALKGRARGAGAGAGALAFAQTDMARWRDARCEMARTWIAMAAGGRCRFPSPYMYES